MTDADHARLVAVLGDTIRAGLDDARVHLPPRAERTVVERAVELLELTGYTLTRVEPAPLDDVEERDRLDEERAILAERCEDLLERWTDDDDGGQAMVW